MFYLDINPLTAAIRDPAINYLLNGAVIRGPARTLPAKWRRYPAARLERYLQNGAVIRMASFTHKLSICLKIEEKNIYFLIISMVLL